MPKHAQPFAVCHFPLDRTKAESEIQVFPSGDFSVPHGAMRGSGPWKLDQAAASALIQKVAKRKTALVVDYEHQSLMAATNGMPAPAAGWIESSALRWDDAGMFAATRWTERAKGMIECGEYAYISPVFTYDEKTGTPTDLLNVALTNNPAIDGMQPVLLAAASRFSQPHEAPPMPMLKDVATLLGVAEDAEESAIIAACHAVSEKLAKADEAITAATTTSPDPAKFAPVAALTALQDQVAALQSALTKREIDDLITPALADGRLNANLESWARDLGAKDTAALKAFLDKAQPIAALSGSQTGGKPPTTTDDPVLTDADLAICSALGISRDAYIKNLEAA
jgi:phage I-like protein